MSECPDHYMGAHGECIDAIKTCGWADHFIKGNILKYLFRHEKKNGLDDLNKAHAYMHMLWEMHECNDDE